MRKNQRQSIGTKLYKKYDNNFNFFFSKHIDDIIYNLTTSPITLDFKDSYAFSENKQYLKRIYSLKTTSKRNEIYDRIDMLGNFYAGADLLKYEYPMMVINNKRDIILRRLKRRRKMVAADCSSQDSSEFDEQNSRDASFESSGFLSTVRTEDLSESYRAEMVRGFTSFHNSYDEEVHDIYYPCSSSSALGEKNPFAKTSSTEEQISHLICDIDDVDVEKASKQLKKAQQKQKKKIKGPMRDFVNKKSSVMKKSNIIITPLESNPEGIQQPTIQFTKNYPSKPSHNNKVPSDLTIKFSPLEKNGRLTSSIYFGEQGYQTERARMTTISNPKSSYISPKNGQYHPYPSSRLDRFQRMDGWQEPGLGETMKIEKKRWIRDKATELLKKVKSEKEFVNRQEGHRPYWKFQRN